ncbi:MAG: thiol reductant ABC exporter subunit CydD, partial [Phycicoccus sp.]
MTRQTTLPDSAGAEPTARPAAAPSAVSTPAAPSTVSTPAAPSTVSTPAAPSTVSTSTASTTTVAAGAPAATVPTGSATSSVPVAHATLVAGLLGGAATASGIALTATSGWLVVRASERPVILTLLVAIVAVRAFGMARPFFRYLERLVSHDAALHDLARRRSALYAALVPLAPARLGRRSRSAVLTGVVDDLTDT